MKITKLKYTILFNLSVAVCMPIIMTFFITIVNIGFTDGFFEFYIKTYIVSAILSLPTTYIVLPLITKFFENKFCIVEKTEDDKKINKNLSSK